MDKKTKKKKAFKFEAKWLLDDECRGVVTKAWKQRAFSNHRTKLFHRINATKVRLKDLSKRKFENPRKENSRIERRMGELQQQILSESGCSSQHNNEHTILLYYCPLFLMLSIITMMLFWLLQAPVEIRYGCSKGLKSCIFNCCHGGGTEAVAVVVVGNIAKKAAYITVAMETYAFTFDGLQLIVHITNGRMPG